MQRWYKEHTVAPGNFWETKHFTKVRFYCKQGYALKNWVEGLSDEAYYPAPGSPKNCQLTIKSFDSSIQVLTCKFFKITENK